MFSPSMPIAKDQILDNQQSVQDKSVQDKYLPRMAITVTELPSKALAYPKNSVIKYKPYTYGDIKKASQEKFVTDIDKFNFVLEGIECSFDKKLLTISDILYLGIMRKISTIGDTKAQLTDHCKKCKEKMISNFNLSTIEFIDLDVPVLPIIVDLYSGTEMLFSPLNLYGYTKLIEVDKEDDDIAILAAQCINIPFEQAYEEIYTSTYQDGELFKEIDQLLGHGLKDVKVKCEKCQHENDIELTGGSALIVPFRESEVVAGRRICFGSKAAHQPK